MNDSGYKDIRLIFNTKTRSTTEREGTFVFDHHNLLMSLRPGFGKRDARGVYKHSLEQCFLAKTEEMRNGIFSVLDEIYRLSKGFTWSVVVTTSQPIDKAILYGFNDFVGEYMRHYYYQVIRPKVNAEGVEQLIFEDTPNET